MFFTSPQDFREREVAPGILLNLAWGERLMIARVAMQPHSAMPLHNHPHEEMGMVLEGETQFIIGNAVSNLKKGDVFLAPPNIKHRAITDDQAVVILEVWSPPREEYK